MNTKAPAPAVPEASDLISVGHVSTPYGVKGWVWVHSLTDPITNLFGYQPWYLKTREGFRPVKVLEWREQGKGIVAQLDISPDRNAAELLRNLEIWARKDALPELEEAWINLPPPM